MNESLTDERLKNISEHIREHMKLLNKYEDKLRLEEDPRKQENYKKNIEEEKKIITQYEQEYNELKNRVEREKKRKALIQTVDRDMRTFFTKLCNIYREKNKNILIVGDVMLDHKMEGSKAKYEKVHSHILGENDVYMVTNVNNTLGGAADIAMAFSEVSRKINLIGVIGKDCEGTTLKTICDNPELHIDFTPIDTKEVLTTTKIYLHRLIGGQKQREDKPHEDIKVIRFDKENSELMTSYCDKDVVRDEIINKINEAVNNKDAYNKIHCIVIKDHEKGMISEELVNRISETAIENNISLYVDPKYHWSKFKNVKISAILPNIKEAAAGIYDIKNEEKENIIRRKESACKLEYEEYEKLVKEYPKCDNFIIKAAEKGAVILSKNANGDMTKEEIKPLNIGKNDFETDVGCGDVFDAFVIIGRLNGYTLEESVLFANFVAGLKTKKPLGELISLDEIEKELKKESFKEYLIDNARVLIK